MGSGPVMTIREFHRRMLGFTAVFSLTTLVMIAGYLAVLLQLSDDERVGFAQLVAGLFPVLFVGTTVVNQRVLAPVVEYLKAAAAGPVDRRLSAAAFGTIASLPGTLFALGLFWWTIGGVLVAGGMALRFDTFSGFDATVMVMAATTGGFVSSVFMFFSAKRRFADLLATLAVDLPPAKRAHLFREISVEKKLTISVTWVTVLTVHFALLLALENTSRPLELHALEQQARFLAARFDVAELADSDIAAAAEEARVLGIASQLLVIDRASGRVVQGERGALLEPDRAAIDLGRPIGDSAGLDSGTLFAWRALDDGTRVVVALLPWQQLAGDRGAIWLRFWAMLGLAACLALALARSLASDLGEAVGKLGEHAARVASGDLRPAEIVESEDELGALSRSFEQMSGSLAATVRQVDDAADGVEASASRTTRVAEGASAASRDQAAGVAQGARSMDSIHQQATGIESSALELATLVDDATSSTLELGSAGEQLAGTASSLFEKVDEVSSAVAQNLTGMRAVREDRDALAATAEETAASMAQMAASMEHVQVAAGQSAELSMQVVETAERGRTAVGETIESMQAVRDGIADAERVLQDLGQRAEEIGSIIGVIDGVADETSLLALNAAIIAAQAGEHGRGFGVVAAQVKQLATRVLGSTREIADRIDAVQQGVEAAKATIADGSQRAASGVARSTESGKALDEITEAARENGDRTARSVSAIDEQTRAARYVADRMERVQSRVEAIGLATDGQQVANEAVLRSVTTMRSIAEQVRGTTSEHAAACRRIHGSIDGVRESSESILEALRVQSASCEEITGFLEGLAGRSEGNEELAGQLERVTHELQGQANRLRQEVDRFQLANAGEGEGLEAEAPGTTVS